MLLLGTWWRDSCLTFELNASDLDERMQAPLTATPLFLTFAPPIAATKGPRSHCAHCVARSGTARLEMRLGLGLVLSSLVDAWRRLFVYTPARPFSPHSEALSAILYCGGASKRLPCGLRHFECEHSWGSEVMLGNCGMAATDSLMARDEGIGVRTIILLG